MGTAAVVCNPSLGSESARAALHAIVGCAGAAGSGANCGAGAMGAAASSVIGSLLAPSDNMSAADRLVRENLVNSLVAGVATGMGASGADMATATGAAQIEVQNNQVSILAPKKNQYATDLVKTFCGTGKCTDEQVKQLAQTQSEMNAASGKNALVVAGTVGAAAAVNAGIITAETAAAIVTNSVTPGVAVEVAGAKAVASGSKLIEQYGPLNQGPLPQAIANTFRGGSYSGIIVEEPTTLYRVYGGTAKELGGYWSRTPPAGPVQSIIDSALNPQ